MSYTVALIGRPNVGKSTLFNRLVGKRLALVDDQPGVTRDLREGAAQLGDLSFLAIDTAGLEAVSDDSLPGRMRKLTERAVEMADACVFILDARSGLTPLDRDVADILRRAGADVILACNKAEGRAADAVYEAWELGLGEPIPISTKPRMSTHAASSSTATKPRHKIKHIPDTETTTESTEVKSESDLFSYLDLTTYDAVTDALKGKVRPEHMPYNAMKTELYARIRHFKQYGHDIIRPAKVTLDHAPPSLYRRGRKNKRLRKFWIKID